jgi:flagella basal body P-ring formation protein FlgA
MLCASEKPVAEVNVLYRILLLLVLLPGAACADGLPRQDLAALERIVVKYLQVETMGLPGQTSFRAGPIDPHLSLNPCLVPEAFLPAGARLWGNSTVGVRCNGDKPWTVFVPVQVHVIGEYLVTARPLGPGQIITASDIAPRTGDLTLLSAGVLTDPEQIVGKTPATSLGAGQALRNELLRAPVVVQAGQSVILQSKGPGFVVRAEGKAVGQAAEGQVVQVRVASGSTVSGIARSGGVVDVTF